MKNRNYLLLYPLLVNCLFIDVILADEDEAYLADLLAVLEETTELATKTRLNADYVPGILTMLHGEELVALGVHTVWEALELVPGVQITRNNYGDLRVSIRGLQHGNGNIKMLLNTVPMNKAYSGYGHILHIPVEQVERIEVIRGPGSAIHGEFAFAGVINIITHKGENLIYGRAGSHDTYGVGGLFSVNDEERDFHLNLNLAGWDTAGPKIDAGTDMLYEIGLETVSHAPGPVANDEDHRLAVLSLDYQDVSLLAQYVRERRAVWFGNLNALPDYTDEKTSTPGEQWALQAGYRHRLADQLAAEFKLRWSRNEIYTDMEEILPPGTPSFINPDLIFTDGAYREYFYRETNWEAESSLDWDRWLNHHWRLDLAVSRSHIDDAWGRGNIDPLTLEPLPEMTYFPGDQSFVQQGASRTSYSLALQDQYQVTDRLDLIAGLRYDRYSDIGDSLSPRLAGVWQPFDGHILKLQYAEAFFPPGMGQVYAVTPPESPIPTDSEQIATLEFSYIFRRARTVARTTLYRSKLDDLIVYENGGFINRGRISLYGVEAEWEQGFAQDWKLSANLSYTDTKDEEMGGSLAGSAHWLSNLTLAYRWHPNLILTGHWRFVGDRDRGAGDPRTVPLAGYHDLAVNLNWFDVLTPGLTLRLGVDNLLSNDIRSPAPSETYREDYPLLQNRRWWTQLSYAF